MAKLQKFEDMDIWQDARQLAKNAYRLSQIWKAANDFELLKALPKTSGSVMVNISEGFGRLGNREFVQFLSIASGSLSEFKSQSYRFSDRPYCNGDLTEIFQQIESLQKRINGFIAYLKQSEIKGYKFKEDGLEYLKSNKKS
tara:strand:+ start:99 stop:524 length:426 start_codon:yes stop_codon:yes gene_type:complete